MIKYPERKTYKYIIPTVYGDAYFKLTQASAKETQIIIEMYQMIRKGDLHDKIYRSDRITTYYKETLLKSFLYTKPSRKSRLIKRIILKNIHLYENQIFDLIHVIPESEYKDEEEPKPENYKAPVFANPAVMSEALRIPFDEIDERITLEQKQRRSDKLTYDYYETFDAGKLVNTRLRAKQGISEQDKELLEYMKSL